MASNGKDTLSGQRPDPNSLGTSSVTELDYDIGKQAYWDLALKKHEDQVECGDSIEMSSTMVSVEKMLEKMFEQPFGDLIFVDAVSSEDFVPLKPSEVRFRESFRRILPKFVYLAKKLPSECKFSPAMELLIDCVNEFSIEDCLDALDGSRVRDRRFFKSKINRINRFYYALKERISSPSVRKKIHDHAWGCENNYRKYSAYVDSLFSAYARLLVVRVDLEYRAGVKRGLSEATKDLDRFFNNWRHNKIFSGVRGRIVKVEFGVSTGYHFHMLVFFDGTKRDIYSDVYIAEQLCDYWCNFIADGKGRAYNGNRDKRKYEKNGTLGLGLVHDSDGDAISNIKKIVRYFCKKEQYFRPVAGEKFKTIRRMLAPSWKGKKPGRPRRRSFNLP